MTTSYFKVVCGVLIWAVINGLIIKDAGSVIAPTVLGALMSLVGVILFLPHLFTNPWPEFNSRQKWFLLGLGLSAALNNSFFYTALASKDSDAKIAGIVLIHYLASIIAIVWTALPIFREKLDKTSLVAITIGFLGLVIMTGENWLGHGLWFYFALLSAFFYSLEIVFSRQVSVTGVDPYFSSFAKLGFQLIVMPLVGLYLGHSFSVPANQYLYIVFAGLLLFVSFILVFSGFKNVPVKHFSVLGYLDRLGAIAIARFWWKESFGLNVWIGGAMILLAELPLLFKKKGAN